jgi:hypothetical protein
VWIDGMNRLEVLTTCYESFDREYGIKPGRMWESGLVYTPTPLQPLVACVQEFESEKLLPSGDIFVAGSSDERVTAALAVLTGRHIYGTELNEPMHRLGRENNMYLCDLGALSSRAVSTALHDFRDMNDYDLVLGRTFGDFGVIYNYDTEIDYIVQMMLRSSAKGTILLFANHSEIPSYFDGLKPLGRHTLIDPLTPEGFIPGMYLDIHQLPKIDRSHFHRHHHVGTPQLLHR